MSRRAFITGTAGFIGFHLARHLLDAGWVVHGYDGMTDYYDVSLKRDRHALLDRHPSFTAHEAMLEDMPALEAAADAAQPDLIVHLAAQAGVRYSLEAPRAYVEANLVGGFNVLEIARMHEPAHLMMASTSSAYGANTEMPFAEVHAADHPLTLYAATKKANEAMAHSYAHLWRIPTTLFRFFTVYGPWGRPDMALYKFVTAMEAGNPVELYNNGDMSRDFTYVDDLVTGIAALIDVQPPQVDARGAFTLDPCDSLSPAAPWRVVNIGNGAPSRLADFVEAIEAAMGQKAERRLMPMQKGDVPATWASTDLYRALTGAPLPRTDLRTGVAAFVDWYRERRG
ncbi:NAD-dependent epimerase/dehydratase family protein [Pontivivens nitratireducens]|uniref:NAD-dependent epimerase/dehydratase family protein n=1 Tax=Pontivivens nitratireducens TaxID=2758038 RepID=A0A6G7VQS2_9RHOB|nr:NAD-dependent epimerase/dehydratase family protein [Pontibrevibacter nitratireducens]QIK42344.1 NAD-dependent epimerase/dehydratase family protein [Pontibrevibacter nitratireducens]